MQHDQHEPGALPSRLALYLSALVYPGAGQLCQRRRLAGIYYALFFSAAFIMLAVTIFRPIFANLRIAMDLAETGRAAEFHRISFGAVFGWLGVSAAVYLAGLLDTWLAYRRGCRHGASSAHAALKDMEKSLEQK